MANFVRGSHEDFGILYKKPEADKVYNAEISFYCKKFICTQGAEPVEVQSRERICQELSFGEDEDGEHHRSWRQLQCQVSYSD